MRDWPLGTAGPTPLGWRWPQPLVRDGIGGWPANRANTLGRTLPAAMSDAVFALDARAGLTNIGTAGDRLRVQSGSTATADTNDPTFLDWRNENYLYLPGVSGNLCTTPDSNALDITGDLEIVARVNRQNWGTGDIVAVAKLNTGTTNQSYFAGTGFTGRMTMRWSPDGTYANSIGVSSGSGNVLPAVSTSSAATYWLKWTLDVDNGAGGYEAKFYYALDQATEPTSWTQLGSTVTGGSTTSIAAGTLQLKIGEEGGLVGAAQVSFYRTIIRDGIGGTVVFDADFTTGITSGGQTSFTESSSNAATVTINRSTSGKKACAVVRPVWLFGTDDYLQVSDNDLLDFGQEDSFSVIAVARRWNTVTNYSRYVAKIGTIGYLLGNYSTGDYATISDGVTSVDRLGTLSFSAGSMVVAGMILDRTNRRLRSTINQTLGATVSTAAVRSIQDSGPLNIGRSPNATGYLDSEIFAVAVWRRQLQQRELAAIATYYGAV